MQTETVLKRGEQAGSVLAAGEGGGADHAEPAGDLLAPGAGEQRVRPSMQAQTPNLLTRGASQCIFHSGSRIGIAVRTYPDKDPTVMH